MAAQKWPECGPNLKYFVPSAQAQPVPKPQARNPTHTMKKVARLSPTRVITQLMVDLENFCRIHLILMNHINIDIVGILQ